MSWTAPRELKAQLARLWDRGEILRFIATGEARFPLRLNLKGPTSSEITERFDAVRVWTADIAPLPHARVEWRTMRHRVHGEQRVPAQVWVDTLDAALAWLGKRADAERFEALLRVTTAQVPALLPWLARRPLTALELGADWDRLLAVVQWAMAHPRPQVHLRQVDVPGVHTKFIERHRGLLAELFDLALPAAAIDAMQSGMTRFALRYGFLDKPVRIRFRVLDDAIVAVPGTCRADVTLDTASFASMQLPVRQVFMTENETNFLALPPLPGSIAIFGAGYGWDAMSQARWLHDCALYYWGDIDTHGFAILDALRAHFPHAVSLLMDRETLIAHRTHWTEEPDPVRHDLARLDAAEQSLYDDLRYGRIASHLRLEQERIGYTWVIGRLAALTADT